MKLFFKKPVNIALALSGVLVFLSCSSNIELPPENYSDYLEINGLLSSSSSLSDKSSSSSSSFPNVESSSSFGGTLLSSSSSEGVVIISSSSSSQQTTVSSSGGGSNNTSQCSILTVKTGNVCCVLGSNCSETYQTICDGLFGQQVNACP